MNGFMKLYHWFTNGYFANLFPTQTKRLFTYSGFVKLAFPAGLPPVT